MLRDATPEFLTHLAGLLPEGSLIAPEPRYLEERRGRWRGRAAAVARPGGVAEVSRILAACHAARVGVVPFAGGTGLVAGQVMPQGPLPLVLSVERMTAIRARYPSESVLIAEAGAILSEVQAAATAMDRLFALSLASEGSARIGGILATNAGGTQVLRYGNARDQVLGLEAVLPDGTVLNGLKRLRKDNTGYDLRHLLIGSEGTLGVITAAALRLHPRPCETGTAFLAVTSPAAALELLNLAQERAPGLISAFELIHRQGVDFMTETGLGPACPLSPLPDWMVLVEVDLPAGLSASDLLSGLFVQGQDRGLVQDGVIAASAAQAATLWALREAIPEANRKVGAVSSHDISLPLSEIPGFLPRAAAAVARIGPLRINAFGHLGDGNLHYNAFPPRGISRADLAPLAPAVTEVVHDLVHSLGGSVSAEHGIGRHKAADLERYADAGKLAAMRAIKAALDPHGIMNPGAVLRGAD
ncbi:MAG: FAD-binding oxidoreductase [Paracoccaceae bacterium]